MTKPSPETIVALKEQVDLRANSMQALEAKLKDALGREKWYKTEWDKKKAEVVTLTAQLKVTTPARGTFEVDPTFNLDKLSPSVKALYLRVWMWLGAERQLIERMLAGRSAGTNEPYPGGVFLIKDLRFVQTYTHALLILLWLFGDLRALSELIRIWPGLVARTATGYGLEATHRRFEQPGIKRWLYHESKVWAGSGASFLGTDDLELEFDLPSGTLAESEYALYQNIPHGAGEAYLALSDYVTNHYQKRLEYLSKSYFPNKPLWTYGKTLRHPTESRYNYHYFRYLLHGRAEDKEAYEWFGNALRSDRELIKTEDGTVLLAQPHGVWARVAQQGGKNPDGGSQDITYAQESHAHMIIAFLADSPFHSREELAALGHTMHQTALTDGYQKDTIAMTIGGAAPVGDKSLNGKRLIRTRDGKTYKSRWVMNRGEQRDNVLALQRGNAMVLSHLTKRDSYKAELEALDKRATHDRHGCALALLLFEAKRR